MELTPEKRAHDVACSLLPKAISEANWEIYVYDKNDMGHINSDVLDEYYALYEYFLKEFKDY